MDLVVPDSTATLPPSPDMGAGGGPLGMAAGAAAGGPLGGGPLGMAAGAGGGPPCMAAGAGGGPLCAITGLTERRAGGGAG